MTKERIGFVGAGLMGHGMAKNIMQGGYPVTVIANRNRQPIDDLIGLGAAVLSALALIMVRSLNRTESPGAIAIYFVLASIFGALLTLPWGWMMPSGQTLMLLVASGLFGGFGHIAMTMAFRYTEASRLAPFEYIALLWPLLADLFIFQLPLSSSFMLATPLVLLGAAIAAFERKNTRQ